MIDKILSVVLGKLLHLIHRSHVPSARCVLVRT